jgi:hypothetical protein
LRRIMQTLPVRLRPEPLYLFCSIFVFPFAIENSTNIYIYTVGAEGDK